MTRLLLGRPSFRFPLPVPQSILRRHASNHADSFPTYNTIPGFETRKHLKDLLQKKTDDRKALLRSFDPVLDPSDFPPGSLALRAARDNDIGFPRETQKFFPRKSKLPYWIVPLLSQRHCFDMHSMAYLVDSHAFAQSVVDRCLARHADSPLWFFIATIASGVSSVVRNAAKRKVRESIRTALRERGYRPNGTKIGSAREGGAADTDKSEIKDIFGTLVIKVHDPKELCKLKGGKLLTMMRAVVQSAETRLKRDHDGKHMTPMQIRRIPQETPNMKKSIPPRKASGGPTSRRQMASQEHGQS